MVTGEEQLKKLYLWKRRNPEEIRGGGGKAQTSAMDGWFPELLSGRTSQLQFAVSGQRKSSSTQCTTTTLVY